MVIRKRAVSLSLVFTVVAIFASACVNSNQQQQAKERDTTTRRVHDTLTSFDDSQEADTLIRVVFPSGDSSVVVSGKLGASGSHVSINVPVHHNGRLIAELMPSDPSANIRFGQVIYPDGKSDGPFGREVSIPAEQNGIYRLIIAHNLMAEGALAGDFKVRVSIGSL